MNYDVLVHVAECLAEEGGTDTLACISLVDRLFNQVAATLLYRSVTLSPIATEVLDLKSRNQELSKQFVSARLPHNAPYVLRLEISGFLSTRPFPLNNFSEVLDSAIRGWTNLQTLILMPQLYHEDVFGKALRALPSCQQLRRLEINASCCDDTRHVVLVQVENLEHLVIENPTRAILQALPTWLSRLQGSLKVFQLKSNCGSVTPGVLNSFLPAISHIRSFGLGLSYSITTDELFGFLSQLVNLAALDVRYYMQLRPPAVRPNMPHLRQLVVRYGDVHTTKEANYLAKWVRLLLHNAPLESLSLIPERQFGTDVNLDGLAEHLRLKHASTLRVLRMESTFLRWSAVKELCAYCTSLEELGVRTRLADTDEIDITYITDRCKSLRTFLISTAHTYPLVKEGMVLEMMRHGRSALRNVIVTGTRWEGFWATSDTKEVYFAVARTYR